MLYIFAGRFVSGHRDSKDGKRTFGIRAWASRVRVEPTGGRRLGGGGWWSRWGIIEGATALSAHSPSIVPPKSIRKARRHESNRNSTRTRKLSSPSFEKKANKRFEGMTGRSSVTGTSLCLLALLLSSLFASNVLVAADPEPIPPELLYSDSFVNNAENLILLNKLKQVIEERKDVAEQEKALNDEQMMIQSVLEARARARARVQQTDYSVEELPAPNAIVSQPQHSGKRTAISYMTLCHFKICNMGRKRQLNK